MVYVSLNIADIIFEDKAVSTVSDQVLECRISGLSQNTPVTWIDPDDNEISDFETNNYVIDQGSYAFGSKVSTLTIKQTKLATIATGSVYKCKVTSALYPTYSPDVVKEMTLTFLGLSKFFSTLLFRLN